MQADGKLDGIGMMCPMPLVQLTKTIRAVPQGKDITSFIKRTAP